MDGERGLTVVEVLVAVMILSVGLLGWVTAAGMVTRMIGAGQRLTQTSTLAGERIETLRAQGCPAVGWGSETRGPYLVAWQVSALRGGRVRGIIVRVTAPTPEGPRTDSLETVHLCP